MGLPVPGVAAHIFEVLFSGEAEEFCRLFAVSIASSDVAAAAGEELIGYVVSAGFGKSFYHVEDGVAYAGTDVEDADAVLFDMFEGVDVGFGQVDDVNIVADAGAVGGVVIVTENAEILKFAYGNLADIGHQIVRKSFGILPYLAAFVSADGVKVTEEHYVPIFIRFLNVGEHSFSHKFGGAVRIGHFPGRKFFGKR